MACDVPLNCRRRWPEAAQPEHWEGVAMENGRVVELNLEKTLA